MSAENPNTSGISTWAIRNPIPTVVFFIFMTFAGLYAYFNLRINNFPDVDIPVVVVTHVQAGAAPAELENQVTRRVEDALSGIGQVKHVNSYVRDGSTTTVVEFQLGVDLEKATNDVRNAVATVRSQLPADIQDPIITRAEASDESLITYIVQADGYTPEKLSWFVDNDVSKAILSKKGVAKVTRDGGVDREIQIKLDPNLLAAKGLTVQTVSYQLRSSNINLPGGRLDVGAQEQAIRTIGNAQTVEQLASTRIALADGTSLRLDELGTVTDTWNEPRQRARFDGKEVVSFSVFRSIGSSEVHVAQKVRQAITELEKTHPNVKIVQVTSSVDWVLEDFKASEEVLAFGAVLAILVVLLFLRDWRATFVSAMAMPMSLLPTFFVLYIMNDSINIVSLLALSLTIGILVDDAIVEIENIVRHMNEGKSAFKAALEAADEIGLAVVATTATIIAVFAPVGFMPGIVGQFFKSFALAACVSVFFSLVVARTLTPLMGAYLLRKHKSHKSDGDPFWMKPYLGTLKGLLSWRVPFVSTHVILGLMALLCVLGGAGVVFFGLKGGLSDPKTLIMPFVFALILFGIAWFFIHQIMTHKGENLHMRWVVLLGGIAFTVVSFMVAGQLKSEFIPAGDDGRTFVRFQLPPGSTLEETDAVVKDMMAELKKRPEVKSTFATMGTRTAFITVNMVPRDKRKLSQREFELDIDKVATQYPGVRASIGAGGGGGNRISFAFVSDDPEALERVTRQLEHDMRGLKTVKNIASSENLTRPEVIITPKPDQAAMMGVSTADISAAARVATVGDYDQILAKYNVGDRQIPIRVLLPYESRTSLEVISNLKVPTSSGGSVPLAAVADIRFGSGPIELNRIDRARSVTINADLNGVPSSVAMAEVRNLSVYKNKPDIVREQLIGDAESEQEMGIGFMVAILTGFGLMYFVLVLLFKNFWHPVTILSALPLSFGGAFFLLLVSGKTLSMPVYIGFIMLVGVAAKNSILLVEYAMVAINKGMSRYDALIDAAHKRARPIIMTTVAMGAGMMPIALGMGASVSFRSPMAVAVVGGLITSTLLSLFFVPVFYTLIDDVSQFFGRHFSKFVTPEKEETVESPAE